MQQHTEMSWPGTIAATIAVAMFLIIFAFGLVGVGDWLKGWRVDSPSVPKTIYCTQWREMEPSILLGRMRCEQWSDGKTIADVNK